MFSSVVLDFFCIIISFRIKFTMSEKTRSSSETGRNSFRRQLHCAAFNPKYTVLLWKVNQVCYDEYKKASYDEPKRLLSLEIVKPIVSSIWHDGTKKQKYLSIQRFLMHHAVENMKNIERLRANPNITVEHSYESEQKLKAMNLNLICLEFWEIFQDPDHPIEPAIVASITSRYCGTPDATLRKKMRSHLMNQRVAIAEFIRNEP
ncbi:uncharacterized protein [Venturia canescens]|uniref:uncharacterized protein n=1 Tax=Venturia canescens TaxID=32260 RepID=UPI001C9D548A|nr:uncharacterized protein LOC122406071 [Venturia canescens]